MNNQEPQTKPDGGASVSTAGLGACGITIPTFSEDEVFRISALCDRLTKAARKLGPCDEAMACVDAQHELTRPFNDAVALTLAELRTKTPNAPHEGPGAASSRTVPLDAVVGRQRMEGGL